MGRAPDIRLLAVSSPGSRWAELRAIARSMGTENAVLVRAGNGASRQESASIRQVTDFSLFSLWMLPICAAQLFWLIAQYRPQLVISTGAAPGVLAIVIGRLFGARCVWIESLTSTDGMSLSGRVAGRFANLWLTQWPDVAVEGGPRYEGAVL